MNKKMVTIIAALAMCTAMAGCSESDTASSSKAETTTTTTAAAESAAPAESTADESTADESTADSTSTTQAQQIMTLTAISEHLSSSKKNMQTATSLHLRGRCQTAEQNILSA